MSSSIHKVRSQPQIFSEHAPEKDFTIINKTGAMTLHNPTAKKMKISNDTHLKISRNLKSPMDFSCDFENSKHSAFSNSNSMGYHSFSGE